MTNLEKALLVIGKDEALRDKFITFIKEVERDLPYNGSVRDDITKYLVDALFEKNDYVTKGIQSGLVYKFATGISSKVAREFLLSTPAIPEYAWEPQTTKLLLHLSKGAKSVFVGGAYFGDQVLPIANQISGTGGKVYAFDLNENQIATLKHNCELNRLHNVVIELKGLWKDSATYLNISDSDDLAFATPVDDATSSNTVTIDEYVRANGIGGVDLIMLDVEGSEYNILLGAKEHLSAAKAPDIVFEIHRSYVDWSAGLDKTPIVELLTELGYKVFSIRDFQGNYDMKNTPIELIPLDKTYLDGPPHGFNMLAIKNEESINNDFFRMCENVSPKYLVHKDPQLHHPLGGFRR